jgi:cytochrome bd ubiquinol oxidase subunit II
MQCRRLQLKPHIQRSQSDDHSRDPQRRHSEGSAMESYLPVIWAAVIGLAVAMYVILDGFDLGIGILFPFAESDHDRDQMMNSVAPFWDGNETWLVLGGAGLMVAFPPAYAIIMPALYLPGIAMLLALVFRGVAFEFRWIRVAHRPQWSFAFAAGSALAAFCQGVILGGLIEGIKVENGAFAGGTFDWATPFAVMCGLGLVAGYGLLGATWLIVKTEGSVARMARARAKVLLLAVLVFMAIVSIWTPLAFERIAVRWFSLPNILFFWWIPAVTLLTAFAAWRSIEAGGEILPFFAAIVLFLLGYLGLLISNFPYLVPPSLTIWQAAAAPDTQFFMLMGTLVMLPIIIGYIIFVYWIFGGKLRAGEGYH